MLEQLETSNQESIITLYDISWEKFEAIASLLEDTKIRLTYLDGILDIISPSREHEISKGTVGLLLETYLRHIGRRFYTTGGYTLGSRKDGARGEPDESYNLDFIKPIPDIAIEVVIISGGVSKLEKYRRWGVPEVWFYQKQRVFIYHLHASKYEQVDKSKFLPELDINLLVRCLNMPDQYDATIAFDQALQPKD